MESNGQGRKHQILELTVNNHPGVMSHVCGLFSRRVYNMDGILCLPVGDGLESRIWLRVDDDGRLDQIVKQLRKLEDVREVGLHGADHQIFVRLEDFFQEK
ncbi:MAG: acetolactate synthase small subunit [Proteobacteria bacterium]|nr:acetolactate synthase small subunit [Pseudomonadota bacterium]MBU1687890.1 acetolactate synthase small subunit [Pseudomonadota bacterium]